MYVNAGELRHRIQIVRIKPAGRDARGFATEKQVTVVRSCWARVSWTSGQELVRANSEFAEARQRFLVRYSPAEISTDMYVRYKGKDYGIVYVNPYGDTHEYTEIWTKTSERAE